MIIYKGDSLRGVFIPGDTLQLEAVPFAELRPGDIVAIEAERPYVHRVIRIDGARITTQGDNNSAPDPQPLTPEQPFLRVAAAASFDGAPRSFHSGTQGMKDFRKHQRGRRTRAALMRLFTSLERLLFWRFELHRTAFAETVVYNRFGVTAAHRSPDGAIRFRNPFFRLIFRLPKGEK